MPKRKLRIQSLRDMIRPRHGYRVMAVDAVIVDGGRLLLQKRSFGMFKGKWVLVGGTVEPGEDAWKACVREAREETGLTIGITRMIGFYDSPGRDPEKNAVSMAFLCRPLKGRPRKSEEADELKWFPLDSVPQDLGFDHADIISDARELLSGASPRTRAARRPRRPAR